MRTAGDMKSFKKRRSACSSFDEKSSYLHGVVQGFSKIGWNAPGTFHFTRRTEQTMIQEHKSEINNNNNNKQVKVGFIPTARSRALRQPDVSLLMLSSISYPDSFM